MDGAAKRYSCLKYTLVIVETAYLIFLLFLCLSSNFSAILRERLFNLTGANLFFIPAYLALLFFGYSLLNFPLNFYHSYILEHKFSLSRQNIRHWLTDQLKGGIIAYIIALILAGAFYYILRHNPQNWWLVISLFWVFFSLILARLTPTLIIPLFFKYKKLPEGALRERIMRLAEKMKIEILDCFEIDFSKKTLKANAAFLGWGKSRRVILADTLKDKYTDDEIEVILAHEFAHYKLKHLLKLIALNSLVTIVIFYLIFKTSDYSLHFFGLPSLSDIAALPLVLIYFVLFGIIMQPFQNYISRRLESNADRMALSVTGFKDAFISMMEKLSCQNLADKNPHPLIKFFFFDHPPIEERIAIAKGTV